MEPLSSSQPLDQKGAQGAPMGFWIEGWAALIGWGNALTPMGEVAARLVHRCWFVSHGAIALLVAFAMVTASFVAPTAASAAGASNSTGSEELRVLFSSDGSAGRHLPSAAELAPGVELDPTRGEFDSPVRASVAELEFSEGESDNEEEERRSEGHSTYTSPGEFNFAFSEHLAEESGRSVTESSTSNRLVFVKPPRGPPTRAS